MAAGRLESTDELARRQGVKPITSLDELAQPDLWESDEEYEAFLADLHASPPHRRRVTHVVVDTDVASAILKGQLPAGLASRLAGQQLATILVTVGDFTGWTQLHRWGPQRPGRTAGSFASVVVLPCTF